MTLYALKLGAIGFGGPVALVGYMHRDLVEDRRWLTEADYKEGLTLAQLAPGPLAAQLAIYLGYCHYGVLGATLVGIAFALPSFLMVLAIGWTYMFYGGLPWMQAIFYSVGAAIIGIIARSAQRLTIRTVGKDALLWVIYLTLAATTFLTENESIPLILLGGLTAWLVVAPPSGLKRTRRIALPVAVVAMVVAGIIVFAAHRSESSEIVASGATGASFGVLWDIFWYFSKAGAFVFGSGLAIVPFLFGGVIKQFQWLTEQQFLDAVAVAMITPGPVVITTGFIGYLVAGFVGACVAAVATFFPCYLFTILPAPFMRKHGSHPAIVAAVAGVTAAATGAIAGAVIVLGKRSIVDAPTAMIALTTYAILWKTKRVPEPVIIVAAGLLGPVIKSLAVG
ncbi:MAG: chromate transporter [Candidatus Poribacteria bacterium]|nr:chromate transporter [Candidatus Poribacteria bacterium]